MANGIFVALFITAFIVGLLLLIWAIGAHDQHNNKEN
jgi:hypothetical protein